jgi:hypothetical protein
MTLFDCSQPLVLDAIRYLGLQKESTENPSYPQISRTPEIIHMYIYQCMDVFQFKIEELEIVSDVFRPN